MGSKIALKNAQDQEFAINHLDNAGAISISSSDIVSKSTAVTDNAVPRFEGVNCKIQNSSVTIDDFGNLLLTSGTGALGYGTGAGGIVAQLTSKSATVTLNKPTGRIITHSEALAAGASVYFMLNNSLLSVGDNLVVNNGSHGAYNIECRVVTNGYAYIYITNTGSIQSQVLSIYFSIIKGATS